MNHEVTRNASSARRDHDLSPENRLWPLLAEDKAFAFNQLSKKLIILTNKKVQKSYKQCIWITSNDRINFNYELLNSIKSTSAIINQQGKEFKASNKVKKTKPVGLNRLSKQDSI